MAQHAAVSRGGKTAAPTKAAEGKTKSRYVPALDGLRAFAVLSVIAYHMKLGWAPGGLSGVTVFFVISGYLINGLLVAEHERTGSISLKGFWLRRVRRLFPAIFLSVVGTAALCTVFNHVLLDKMRPDILPSLLFYNNWWQIFRDVSYFEAAGSPSPLQHFWSLSIEEQFYVVWPLLLLLMYRVGMKKTAMSRIVLVLAALSAVEMALLYNPQGDPSRIYYGTDTRAMSLLLGVWLAFVWPSAAFGKTPQVERRNNGAWIAFNVAGVIALVGLVAIVVFTNGFSAFPYLGGIAITTVLSAVLIAVLAVPDTWMARVFSLAPLVWIGKRSYAMYLWHFPILLLMLNPNVTTAQPWWLLLVELALIVLVSELSFRFVEDPIRKGKIGKWLRSRRSADGQLTPTRLRGVSPRVAVPLACFAGLLIVACVGVFIVPPTNYAQDMESRATGTTGSPPESGSLLASDADAGDKSGESPSEKDGDGDTSDAVPLADADLSTYENVFQTPHLNEHGNLIYEPLLIGDSVSLGAEDSFEETFPNGRLDSVVSRHVWESPYKEYLDDDRVGEFVIFCLGTNDPVTDQEIDELFEPVGDDKCIIMMNTRTTDEWCASTNDVIARAADRYPNLTVIDWFGESKGHDDWFDGDGTHLTLVGAEAYVSLIEDALKDICADTREERIAKQEERKKAALAEQAVWNFLDSLKPDDQSDVDQKDASQSGSLEDADQENEGQEQSDQENADGESANQESTSQEGDDRGDDE